MNTELSNPIAPTTTYKGSITDSDRWASFVPRAGDVIVCTPPKSGTTWTQGILSLLIAGDPSVEADPSTNAPWFDSTLSDLDEVVDRLAAQTGRRHVKTHTALDGVPIWEELRYITVYRHPIDVHFSARKHVSNYRPEVARDRGIDLSNFPADPRASFRIFIETDDFEDHASLKTIVNHYKQSLERAGRENLLRLHYADMTRDLAGAVQKIADHVGITHPPDVMDQLVSAATFGSMKANAGRFGLAPGKEVWRNDAGFFDSASSNKWDGILTDEDLADYDAAISRLLEDEPRKWLEWGSL